MSRRAVLSARLLAVGRLDGVVVVVVVEFVFRLALGLLGADNDCRRTLIERRRHFIGARVCFAGRLFISVARLRLLFSGSLCYALVQHVRKCDWLSVAPLEQLNRLAMRALVVVVAVAFGNLRVAILRELARASLSRARVVVVGGTKPERKLGYFLAASDNWQAKPHTHTSRAQTANGIGAFNRSIVFRFASLGFAFLGLACLALPWLARAQQIWFGPQARETAAERKAANVLI